MGLAGTLALLAATVAVLFGVALTTEDECPRRSRKTPLTRPRPTPLDSDELLALSLELSPAVARRVEKIRGLEFDEVRSLR